MKNKKKKDEVENFVLGKKIRDVKTSEKHHFLLFVSVLILFNLFLVASVWFVLQHLKDWYNWVVCFSILAVAFGMSLKVYRDTNKFNKFEIYDNAIVINSIWMNLLVPMKDICEMTVKNSKLDKLIKLDTKSLEVKLLGQKRKKFTIHFIEENVVKLKQEIIMLMDKDSGNKIENNE